MDDDEEIEIIEVTDAAVGAKPKWSGYNIDAETIYEYMPHTLREGDRVVLPYIHGWMNGGKGTGPIWEFYWTVTKETSLLNGVFIVMDAYNRQCGRNKCEPRSVFLEGVEVSNTPSGKVFRIQYGT